MLKILASLILVGLVSVNNTANSEESLSLPKSKLDIVQCQKQVLSLHPGEIASQKIVDIGTGGSEIHFEIHDKKFTDWLVICDGVTAKIINTVKLDDER